MQTKWIYYNHALIPDIAPHETIEIPKFDKNFWKNSGGGGGISFACSMDFGFRL